MPMGGAVTESVSTLPSPNSTSARYQTIETAPITSVAKLGVRKRGCTVAKRFGSAPARAMEMAVRAAGRIVVWVQADAELSTARINSQPTTGPSTVLASG